MNIQIIYVPRFDVIFEQEIIKNSIINIMYSSITLFSIELMSTYNNTLDIITMDTGSV